MTKTALLALIGSVLLEAAPAITDTEIRRRASQIEALAATESPAMGVDTLLMTAQLLQPYTPDATRRLHAAAVRRARQHPDLKITSASVKRWMELDPANAEAELRKLEQRRLVLESLVSYHVSKRQPERAASLAVEAMETARDSAFNDSQLLRYIATANPVKAVDLYAPLAAKPQARHFADSTQGLFEGLFEATGSRAVEVQKAIDKLKPNIVADENYAEDSESLLTTQFEFEGRKIKTTGNRSTILEYIALLEGLLDPARRDAARKAERLRMNSFSMRSAAGNRPAIPADLPLAEAIAEIEGLEPARMRLSELWRYAIGKPRTEEEARPIVNTLIEWAGKSTYEADPFWFTSSLLNLDGRLGPRGQQRVLPPALRPAIFHAAARAGTKTERNPERLLELVEAMRTEKVSVPADAPSAKARNIFLQLRSDLESRYDFMLTSLDGGKRRLQDERGKVVVLNFWATWCGPCRAEMPAIARVYETIRSQGVEVFAITDEASEKVKGFVEKNPLALPVLLDPDRKVFDHYRVHGLPQTFVLDAGGAIERHFVDAIDEQELRTAITQAKEKSSKQQ